MAVSAQSRLEMFFIQGLERFKRSNYILRKLVISDLTLLPLKDVLVVRQGGAEVPGRV